MNARRRERKGGRGNWSKYTVWSVEATFICDVRWSFRKMHDVEKA